MSRMSMERRRTLAAQAFKEAAFTSRMASESRDRARMAWKAKVATGTHDDETRRLETILRVREARQVTAQDHEDQAWTDYLEAARLEEWRDRLKADHG